MEGRRIWENKVLKNSEKIQEDRERRKREAEQEEERIRKEWEEQGKVYANF